MSGMRDGSHSRVAAGGLGTDMVKSVYAALVTIAFIAGCVSQPAPRKSVKVTPVTPSHLSQVDPTDADAIAARIRAVLPKGWWIISVERNTYPSYRPQGHGIGVFIGPSELRQRKRPYEAAVYVMPPDYDDGGADPTGGMAQTWPARLVAWNDQMKVYVWGGWNGGQDPVAEVQIRDALVK